jgi:putative phage-type endonuclease
MIVHKLKQGSPEWHAHRRNFRNASDAPAMMGCSPYQTREELLLKMSTGLAEDVSEAQQQRFDDGHRYETLCRGLAEKIIGERLYPITGTEGNLGASFDGLTMSQEIAYEHKSLNNDLRAVMVPGATGRDLALAYQVQMEQQCMVSGCKRVLFMASKWKGDELAEPARHVWYESNPELAEKIRAGWAQIDADLEGFQPQVAEAKPVGHAPELLPALRIEVTGMVTASNLDLFKGHALAVFNEIKTDLQSDQDFADAEKTVKWCGEVEDKLAAAKRHALSQTESIDALFRAIDDISAMARQKRLELDRLVKSRKDQIRLEIVQEGDRAYEAHRAGLNERLGRPYLPNIPADFAGVVKGMKKIDSLRAAVKTELARVKIATSAAADKIEANLKLLAAEADGLQFLFNDAAAIVNKERDDFATLVRMRVADHKAEQARKEEVERERIRAEEVARIEREERDKARVKAEAEERQRRAEEADRIAKEQATRTQPLTTLAPSPAAAPATVVPLRAATPAPAAAAPMTQPTLKLGDISARLAPISLTAEGLKSLGFVHAAQQGATKFFHEADFSLICAALVRHVEAVQAKQAA